RFIVNTAAGSTCRITANRTVDDSRRTTVVNSAARAVETVSTVRSEHAIAYIYGPDIIVNAAAAVLMGLLIPDERAIAKIYDSGVVVDAAASNARNVRAERDMRCIQMGMAIVEDATANISRVTIEDAVSESQSTGVINAPTST